MEAGWLLSPSSCETLTSAIFSLFAAYFSSNLKSLGCLKHLKMGYCWWRRLRTKTFLRRSGLSQHTTLRRTKRNIELRATASDDPRQFEEGAKEIERLKWRLYQLNEEKTEWAEVSSSRLFRVHRERTDFYSALRRERKAGLCSVEVQLVLQW